MILVEPGGVLLTVIVIAIHVAGLACAVRALMVGRTAQGTIAWIVALALFPYLALPLYSTFGLGRFNGYIRARRTRDGKVNELVRSIHPVRHIPRAFDRANAPTQLLALERLAEMPFTRGNGAELLIDGEATFKSIFEGIAQARRYLLVQFYIIHDDEIGCQDLPRAYMRELRSHGIATSSFNASRGVLTRHWRINFRNHRKIVVADGHTAWVGGINIGEEYVGRHPKLSPWRDTHLRLRGPAIYNCQLAFVEDWYWATGAVPNVEWKLSEPHPQDLTALVLPTGPADEFESCGFAFGQMIAAAAERILIATPYFIPDSHVLAALQLAALRGVSVRILLPATSDNPLTCWATFSYLQEMLKAGIEVRFYRQGMLHQKVAVFDDLLTAIGTANFDNRSFRLNFETTVIFWDREFAATTARMIEKDLRDAEIVTQKTLDARTVWARVASQAARLLAPIL